MKKNLVRSVVLLAVSCVSGFAEEVRIRANIPFAFGVAGTTMPAGEYTITPLPGFGSVLLFRGESSGARALVMAQSMDTTEGLGSSLVFTMGTETAMLTKVKGPGRTFEVNLAKHAPKGPLATVTLPAVAALRTK